VSIVIEKQRQRQQMRRARAEVAGTEMAEVTFFKTLYIAGIELYI